MAKIIVKTGHWSKSEVHVIYTSQDIVEYGFSLLVTCHESADVSDDQTKFGELIPHFIRKLIRFGSLQKYFTREGVSPPT